MSLNKQFFNYLILTKKQLTIKGESFILHRKNTSNTNLNSASNDNNNNYNSQNEISSPILMPGSNNIHELSSNISSRRPDCKFNNYFI